MHINNNKCIDGNLLLFSERLSNKLYKVIKLCIGALEILLNFMVGDGLLDESGPPDLGAV
jgi:hypothetical protein